MADSLHDQLTDIHGIGDAKADQIQGLVDEHSTGGDGDIGELLAAAEDYLEDDRPGYALKYIQEARRGLEGD